LPVGESAGVPTAVSVAFDLPCWRAVWSHKSCACATACWCCCSPRAGQWGRL